MTVTANTNFNLAPMFHEVYRDALGEPAANGAIETYRALSHATQKAVYQDKDGTIEFPNPISLNAAGVVATSASNGAPKAIYWADDEDYYVVVKDSSGNVVQTIDNYNSPLADLPGPSVEEMEFTNYILNPQYRLLIKSKYENTDLPSAVETPIAEEDWFFYRDTANSTNVIEYKEFTLGQTTVPNNPKYYLNFQCTSAGVELRKDVCVVLGDSTSFANEQLTFAFYAKSATVSSAQLILRQEFGTGGSPSAAVETILETFTLTTSFAQYSDTFIVPDITGKTLGTNGDDRTILCLRMPLNAISNIDWTNLQLNRGDKILEFDYKTTQQENLRNRALQLPDMTNDGEDRYKAVSLGDDGKTEDWVSNPPIGGMLDWYTETPPAGWLECDGASYTALGTSRYRRLWNVIGNRAGYGEDGFYPFTSSNRLNIFNTKLGSVTDIADVNTNFTFSTTQEGGDKGFTTVLSTGFVISTNKANGAVTAAGAGTSGFTPTTLQTGTGSLPDIVKMATLAATGLGGKYFSISSASPAADYYVWFTVDGVGVDPAVGGRTGIKIDLGGSDTADQVAEKVGLALKGGEESSVICNAASTLTGGESFHISSVATNYYVWYTIAGVGTDPAPASKTAILVALDGTETNAQVATKTATALSSAQFQVPDLRGQFVRGYDHGAGVDPDAATRTDSGGGITGDNVGTKQDDNVGNHKHSTTTFNAGAGAVGLVELILETITQSTITPTAPTENRPINIYLMKIIKY
jgi:hypothetical protein